MLNASLLAGHTPSDEGVALNHAPVAIPAGEAQQPANDGYEVVLMRGPNDKFGLDLLDAPDGTVAIGCLYADYLAARSGMLCTGDLLISLDGESLAGMSKDDVSGALLSRSGEVRLRVRAPPSARAVRLVRPASSKLGCTLTDLPRNQCCCWKVFEGFPAAAARLSEGDVIVAVNGRSTAGLVKAQVEGFLASIPGTIDLRVQPPLGLIQLTVLRSTGGGGKLGLDLVQPFPHSAVRVSKVYPNQAAALSGLAAEDVLYSVGGRTALGLNKTEVTKLLAQPGDLPLQVIRPAAPRAPPVPRHARAQIGVSFVALGTAPLQAPLPPAHQGGFTQLDEIGV